MCHWTGFGDNSFLDGFDWIPRGLLEAFSQVRDDLSHRALDAECIHDLICSIERTGGGEDGSRTGRKIIQWSVVAQQCLFTGFNWQLLLVLRSVGVWT